jgi:hypothetical protein
MSRDVTSRLSAVIGLAILLLAGRTTLGLWRFASAARELPLWDEAKYGLDGARVAAAVADFDLAAVARSIYDRDLWPPLFPIFESGVFLAFGDRLTVARGLVAILFLPFALGMWWAAREIAPASPAVGAVAAALAIASPFAQLFSTLVMLELPGALLYLLALGAYARFLRTGHRAAMIATGLLSGMLFFTKYNYGLLWLIPLFSSEAWIACGGGRPAVARALAAVRRIDLRRPFTAFVAVYLVGLAALAVTGGGTLRIGGIELGLRSIGNPLYVLVLLVIARALWRPRQAWARFRRWELGLAERHRILLWTVAVPAALWLLLPPHLRGFVEFLGNRSAGPPPLSGEGLLFHPRAWIGTYHASPLLGVAVVAAAMLALLRIRRAAPPQRALLLALAWGVAATALHPYKEERFSFVIAPLLWVAAAWNTVTLVERMAGRGPLGRAAVGALVSAVALVLVARGPVIAPDLGEAFARHTVPASSERVVGRIVELAARYPSLVLGTWNQASAPLVEWSFLQRHGVDRPPRVVVPSRRGGSGERVLRELGAASGPQQVVLLALAPADGPSPEWAAAFLAETSWLEPVRRSLEESVLPYRSTAAERIPGTGYELLVFGAVSRAGRAAPGE